jgi:hypothetical protein
MNDKSEALEHAETDHHPATNGTAVLDPEAKAKAVADAAIAAAANRYPPVYQSMLCVGLLGSAYGRDDDTDIISAVLEPTLPDPVAYRINRAMAQGLHGNGKAAEATLQAVIDANPNDDCTKVVLALTKMFAGDPEWQTVLENLFASSTDPVARTAATNVVAYLMQHKS